MTSIVEFMTAVHRQCDEGFASAEEAVSKENWPEVSQQWTAFANEMALHFAREEKVLFPMCDRALTDTGRILSEIESIVGDSA